jgi:hypothetical protein
MRRPSGCRVAEANFALSLVEPSLGKAENADASLG